MELCPECGKPICRSEYRILNECGLCLHDLESHDHDKDGETVYNVGACLVERCSCIHFEPVEVNQS